MLVSVIVPNYNHRQFLQQRLDSIFNQTYQHFEVILLDDCSSDGSWEYLKFFKNHPKVKVCIRNEINSGSPFKQWVKGIKFSNGELIWIAESDDFSDSRFLENCIPYFKSFEDVCLVMSSSEYVDEMGLVIEGPAIIDLKGKLNGNEFVESNMYFRNSIINASSVLFRKNMIKKNTLANIIDYRLSGDYLFWVELMKNNSIVLLTFKLNFFRWHCNSVRYQELNNLTEILEGIKIKQFIENNFQISDTNKSLLRRSIYLRYFKILKSQKTNKSCSSFISILSFFRPLDRIKGFFRFFALNN